MARGDREGPRGQFRVRVIAFVLGPVLVLGICYFLLVEYVAVRPDVVLGEALVGLRLSGAALIVLALVLAVAAGYLLADRVARPIRLLLRFAESGDLPAGAGLFVHHRDWEVFLLYRRIQALIQQNRAGAGALDQLESLRASFETLRVALARTGQNGVLAPLGVIEGPCEDIAGLLEAHRARLLDFFRDLRTRAEELRAQFEALESVRRNGAGSGRNGLASDLGRNGEPADGTVWTASGELSALTAELRRIGTVLSLEVERTRVDDVAVGSLYREFRSAIDRLEEFARSRPDDAARTGASDGDGDVVGTLPVEGGGQLGDDELGDVWLRLREDLGSLERRLEEVEER